MASAYLSQTISSSTGKIFTLSMWVKRANVGSSHMLFHLSSDSGNTNYLDFAIKNNDRLDVQLRNGSNTTYYRKRLNRLFRDVNAWYHLVWRFDSTNSTADDRWIMYVNGERATDIDLDSTPSQVSSDYVTPLNRDGATLQIGNVIGGSMYLDGSLAHVHLCDGYSYAPTEFGETDSTTGIWKPKTSPSVSYGTNGFFLKFDNSANMGLDSGGGSNNFTTNGTIIQNKDTPTNVFNTLSPIDIPIAGTSTAGTLPTLSNANTSITNSNSAFREVRSNFYVTKGKYYFEAKPTRIGGSGAFQVGVVLRNYSSGSGERRTYQNNGNKYTPGSGSYGASYVANDIIGVALNLDDGEITFYKNGVSQGVAATDMLTGMDNIGWTAAINGYDADGHINFGNGYFGTTQVSSAQNPDDGIGIFEYSVPTGYKALCTKSINAQEYS